ncbi:hypothetical protein [endosymbiont GvMRE of Glomus versiforme]|uniref:hypothetical protein n=1 Tax=endosymbiont GvMRE of Glomus versiforme TaxID=2039283 RepID=UPI000EC00471|nr:hypothetical protein [endosymbiont GvMRE of Glomus versiforme]RHZ36548.1 hypothetical protein GvMRE_I2g459 [endosymbiont GvMRE of Glomus versiforme]
MNNEREITEETRKEIERNDQRIYQLNDYNNDISDKLEQKNVEDKQKQAKTLEKEIEVLNKDLDDAESINESIKTKLDSYASMTGGSGAPQEIYKVFIPGGSDLRLNYFQLNNIAKQMNAYFSRLDNPFLDSYNAAQREELVRSILDIPTTTVVPSTPSNVITVNNSTDPNWRKKEPQPGKITEPTYQSYEWFQRWWEFLRNYARKELVWGPYEEIKDCKIVITMQQGTYNGSKVSIRNSIEFAANKGGESKIYGSWFDDYLPKKRNDTSAKAPYMFIVGGHGPSAMDLGIKCVDHISFSAADWICLFNEEFFPTDTLGKNLLINENLASNGTNYKVGPDAWRDTNTYAALHTSYYTLINGRSDNFEAKNYKVHGLPDDNDASSNYIEVKIGDEPYKFENVIAPGLRGMIDLSHDIFDKNGIKNEFYKNEPIISLQSCNIANSKSGLPTNGKPPSFFTMRKIDVSFNKGEIQAFVDVNEKRDEIKEKQRKINDINIEYYTKEERVLLEQRRLNEQEIKKLQARNAELTYGDEKRLRERVVRLSGNVKTFLSRSPVTKRTWSWYENYEKEVGRLQEVLRQRLKEDNKWEDNDKKYTDFKLTDPAIESYFVKNADKDETKSALAGIREAWEKYDNTDNSNKGLKQRLEDSRSKLYVLLGREKITNEKDVDKWLENMDNNKNKIVKDALGYLDKMNELITLSENELAIREKLKGAKLAVMNLEATLREILKDGNRYNSRILAAWQGAGYGEGNDFYDLITYKNDLRTDENFKTWMKEDKKGGPKYKNDSLSEWIAEKSLTTDLKSDLLGYILKYRLNQYIEASTDDRKDYKNEVVLSWINKLRECNLSIDDFVDINGGDNRKGDAVLNDFLRRLAKKPGDAMGLDSKNDAEYRIIQRWVNQNYKEETLKSLKDGIDEEFLKAEGKDIKSIWNAEPKEIHKKVRNYQINKEGITSEEEVKKITAKDKEKLERVIGWLDDLINNNLATEEQKTLRQQANSHLATLTTETTPPGGTKPPTGEEEDKKPPTTGEGDKKPEDGKEQEPPKKGLPGWAWVLIIVGIVAIVGGLIWYLTSGKKGGEEEEGVTEPEAEK